MSRTITDTCPHCNAELNHPVEAFGNSNEHICGECGNKYYCVRNTPYPNFTLYVLSKSPERSGSVPINLERNPSEEEWEEIRYSFEEDEEKPIY